MGSEIGNYLLIAFLVITTGLSATASPYSPTGRGSQESTINQLAAALEAGGLYEAARLAGGHYTRRIEYELHPYTFGSVQDLARVSENIVIGDVLESKSHLSRSATYITTDYKVRVVDSLLGRIPRGTEIVLSVLGGTFVFSDGLSAAVDTPDFVRPMVGESILAFLSPISSNDAHLAKEVFDYASGDQVFQLAGAGRGMFGLSLDESRRVLPKSQKSDKLSEETRKKDVRTFLKEVRDAIEKEGR